MDSILAIDVGTQSLRACIIDPELSELERQQVPYTPRVISRDQVEIDAEILWDALVQACSRLKHRDRVKVITFSTLCPSLLPMDVNGNPLRPIILHLDRRSYKQAQWALKKVGEEKFTIFCRQGIMVKPVEIISPLIGVSLRITISSISALLVNSNQK